MVRAWYYKDSDDDQRMSHQHDPPQFVSVEELMEKTGIIFWRLNADLGDCDPDFRLIKKERGYGYQELIEVSPSTLPNYEQQLKNFFTEHLHDHEEIRFILQGSGYWDVRDHEGKWIRFEIKKCDMLTLPPGMYHRFTLDTGNYIKAIALYIDIPSRIQHSRSHFADEMECRTEYVHTYLRGGTSCWVLTSRSAKVERTAVNHLT